MTDPNPTAKLKQLWAGDFGDAYLERNREAARGRDAFWNARLSDLPARNALEVGCNVGGNLVWLGDILGAENVAGVDVNEAAVRLARDTVPGADIRVASAYDLPFQEASFDLVFTTGVLIHLPPDCVEEAIAEVVRCSRRFILCGEYFAEQLETVTYRGQHNALFKQNYGDLYRQLHPELELRDSGFLPASGGVWDDVTWWLFAKR